MPTLGRLTVCVSLSLPMAGWLALAAPTPEPAKADYRPVAPAAALQASLESNLKILNDWLNDKDYASAADTAQALVNLASICEHQSPAPEWRQRVAALRQTCDRLLAAAGAKNAEACAKAAKELGAQLAELSKQAPGTPGGERQAARDFKPVGTTRSWMLLMDGTYSDAKNARTGKELENLAFTLAEGTNVVQHMSGDAEWRSAAVAARDAALAAAGKAKGNDLAAARTALKTVYMRCEGCHAVFKK